MYASGASSFSFCASCNRALRSIRLSSTCLRKSAVSVTAGSNAGPSASRMRSLCVWISRVSSSLEIRTLPTSATTPLLLSPFMYESTPNRAKVIAIRARITLASQPLACLRIASSTFFFSRNKHQRGFSRTLRPASRSGAIKLARAGPEIGFPNDRTWAKCTNEKRRTFVRLSLVLAEWTGLEPATPGVTGRYSNQLNYHSKNYFWWVLTGSNRRHSPCKGDALPAELSTRQSPLVYSILQAFASAKFRNLGSLDLDCRASARIAAVTCGAFAN